MSFLVRAMMVSHRRAQRLGTVYAAVSVALAVAGFVSTFVERIAVPVTLLGALWAIAHSAGLASWMNSGLRRAAILQEMFDTRLYGMRWNQVAAGDPIETHEVSRLANRYNSSEEALRDYYEIPPSLPVPYDVIACQFQNLAWGARVRRRYSHVLLIAIVCWNCAGLVVGVLGGLTVVEIGLRWYVPSLGALLLAWDSYRTQRDVAGERERVMGIIRARLSASHDLYAAEVRAAFVELARSTQDLILQTRLCNIRVPDWFFARFQERDRIDFYAVVSDLESMLHGTRIVAGTRLTA